MDFEDKSTGWTHPCCQKWYVVTVNGKFCTFPQDKQGGGNGQENSKFLRNSPGKSNFFIRIHDSRISNQIYAAVA